MTDRERIDQEQLDIAGQVLDLLRTHAGATVEAEVAVGRRELALTRFANSSIHQNMTDTSGWVRVRVHQDGRTAAGSTTLTTTDGLRGLAERTVAAARLCPPDPGWPGLAPPAPLTHQGSYDEATAAASPDDRAARIRDFVAAAGGLRAAGYCRTEWWAGAFANSAGQAVTGWLAEAAMDGIARLDTADGVARLAGPRLSDIDGGLLGLRAAVKARAGVDPVELPPGRYEVVLEPTAVADLLENLAFFGFNGKTFVDRRSFVVPGEQQFDPSLTIVDDEPGVGSPATPYDAEGTPKQRLVLVEAGVTRAVTFDRRTAAKAGATSTGHAMPPGGKWGPLPLNPRILATRPGADAADADGAEGRDQGAAGANGAEPGAGAPPGGAGSGPVGGSSEVDGPVADASVAALIAGVERGILVTDLWYTRVLDPKTLVVTGLTRNGIWLIENGKVVTPVRNFRFTQSYPQALAPGAVLGVGSRATPIPGVFATTRACAPALHLAAWNFTGGASG